MRTTQLLIIGAGPYGLATSAYAKHQGLDFRLVGHPMEFWRQHMPGGLFLRSRSDRHLDPLGVYTFEAYMKEKGIAEAQARPIPVELFREYAQWFQDKYELQAYPFLVQELRRDNGLFEAILENGESCLAETVLLALGYAFFANKPEEIMKKIPAGSYSHTCDLVSFDFLKGRRCLIIGGGQSAYEWAALINEQGAEEIHISHRHAVPRFEKSDQSWMSDMVRYTDQNPGWFRRSPLEEQEATRRRFWAETRLKLEPWLRPRIDKENIHLWPNTNLADCTELPDGRLRIKLDNGAFFVVDHVILATGYRVNVGKVPFLSRESILSDLRVADGYPVLDECFQSSVPGLFFSGLLAIRDFGPFFGFIVGCPVAARIIVEQGVLTTVST